MPPTKRKGKGKSKAEPPLLPSDDFERLPSLETWQRRQLETTPHNRRGEILSDDASNCVPSVPPPSSDDSIDSKAARKELKKDLRSLRPNRPVAPQRAARYTTTLRSVSVIPETSPAASSSESESTDEEDDPIVDEDPDDDELTNSASNNGDNPAYEGDPAPFNDQSTQATTSMAGHDPIVPASDEEEEDENEQVAATGNPFNLTQDDILSFIDQPTFLNHNATQALNPLGTKTRHELQLAFQQVKAKGNMPLINFVYDMEIACTTLRDADRDFTVKEMYMVYLFLHEKIVDGLIDGTLPRSLNDQSSEEYHIHQKLLQRATSARNPAYYMATITSQSGKAPTFRDMEKALNMFDQYCDGDMSSILQIDRRRGVAADKSKTGFRFFFADANDRFVTRRLQVCMTFSRNLRAQLNSRDWFREGKNALTPFRDFLAYFGVSGNIPQRFNTHEAGFLCNTNYVMQLFLECLRVTQRDKLEPYEIRKFVVGLCGEPQHAALGEILVSRLGQGYITSRTGFAHYPAGQGVDISLSAKEWDNHFAWMEDNTPFWDNHRKTMQQMEAAKAEEAARQPVQVTILSRSDPAQAVLLQLVKKYRREFEPDFMQDEIEEVD